MNNNRRDTIVSLHPGPPPASLVYARQRVAKDFENSNVIDRTDTYPKFAFDELKLGKVLGKGGFGTVSEIKAFRLRNGNSNNKLDGTSHTSTITSEEGEKSSDEVAGRNFLATHCMRGENSDARYAIKKLSPEIVSGEQGMLLRGIVDLAIEARFLSDIEHPNIIKLRATAQCEPCHAHYFLVMDRLYDTMQSRLVKWKTRAGRSKGLVGRLSDRKGKKSEELYEERIVAAFDLAAALDYLHKRNIIYRDLKPENIGFDVRNDVKLFDFGLAKELKDSLRNPDGTYMLTGVTGSLIYMAPEVGNSQPYNATCDSYSFSILLWEMLVLKTPYELYTPKSLRAKVYNGEHKRPPIPEDTMNQAMKLCLNRGWTQNLHERSTMEQTCAMLRKECVRIRKGDEQGLEHHRRRSTFVFRRSASKAHNRSQRFSLFRTVEA